VSRPTALFGGLTASKRASHVCPLLIVVGSGRDQKRYFQKKVELFVRTLESSDSGHFLEVRNQLQDTGLLLDESITSVQRHLPQPFDRSPVPGRASKLTSADVVSAEFI